MNDEQTAWKYAFDIETIRKNCMEIDYSNIEYNILHKPTGLEDLLCIKEDIAEIEIKTEYDLELKLTNVIRRCFKLSSSELEKMLNADIITTSSSIAIKKCKVRNGVKIYIDKDKLKIYLEKMV